MSWRLGFRYVWQYLRARFWARTARRRVDAMISNGLPRHLQRPLFFLFDEKLDRDETQVMRQVENLRARLRRRADAFSIHNDARTDEQPFAASATPAKLEHQTGALLASYVSISRYWGVFLHLCANAQQARVILELGSCAGISGAYLAASPFCQQFITIDGSRDAATLAESNIRQVTKNYRVINADFENALTELLPTVKDKIDLVYIDGDHEKEPTLHYFQRIIPYLNTGALVFFDDITWSNDMWSAWQTLARWQGISHAIHLGRLGLCIWAETRIQPSSEDLSIFSRDWVDHSNVGR